MAPPSSLPELSRPRTCQLDPYRTACHGIVVLLQTGTRTRTKFVHSAHYCNSGLRCRSARCTLVHSAPGKISANANSFKSNRLSSRPRPRRPPSLVSAQRTRKLILGTSCRPRLAAHMVLPSSSQIKTLRMAWKAAAQCGEPFLTSRKAPCVRKAQHAHRPMGPRT